MTRPRVVTLSRAATSNAEHGTICTFGGAEARGIAGANKRLENHDKRREAMKIGIIPLDIYILGQGVAESGVSYGH
jgi:hypothetical protein